MMTLTNEDLDAIRKIVDDRAVQTEKLISMSFAQLGARISFMGQQQMQFHPKSGNQLQFQQNIYENSKNRINNIYKILYKRRENK